MKVYSAICCLFKFYFSDFLLNFKYNVRYFNWDIRWRRAKIITRIESKDDITLVLKKLVEKNTQQL